MSPLPLVPAHGELAIIHDALQARSGSRPAVLPAFPGVGVRAGPFHSEGGFENPYSADTQACGRCPSASGVPDPGCRAGSAARRWDVDSSVPPKLVSPCWNARCKLDDRL